MLKIKNPLALPILAGVTLILCLGSTRAAVFDESTLGDLSNNQGTPTTLSFSSGINRVIGNVNGVGDSQDWITFNVPIGYQLTSEVLAAYTSSDGQGFTGFHSGTSFPGSTFDPASYNGYSHFGTAAQNNVSPPVNLVGADLLPIMADPNQAPGSTGFAAPLGAGDYTFLVQQLGSSTAYEFDFTISAIPEPTALALAPLAMSLIARYRRGQLRTARFPK
jgi:hypothetical protein